MNIILLDRVANLGNLGDQVSVKAGYARNFLLPQGKAVVATPANVEVFEARRAELEAKANAEIAAATARAESLAAVEGVVISTKAGDEGKLFGSIGVRDIAEAFTAAGAELNKNEVRLPEGPLRHTGAFEVTVQLHPEVKATIKLSIEAE